MKLPLLAARARWHAWIQGVLPQGQGSTAHVELGLQEGQRHAKAVEQKPGVHCLLWQGCATVDCLVMARAVVLVAAAHPISTSQAIWCWSRCTAA